MPIICRFADGDVGTLPDDAPLANGVPLPFMPYRSLAHLRLTDALARNGRATVELRGPTGTALRQVSAMTPNTITLAFDESPG